MQSLMVCPLSAIPLQCRLILVLTHIVLMKLNLFYWHKRLKLSKIIKLLIQLILVQILPWTQCKMHHKGGKIITILEIIKTTVNDIITIPIFLEKEIFVIFMDFPIIEEVLVIQEEVILVVLMVVEDIIITTNHNVSSIVGQNVL